MITSEIKEQITDAMLAKDTVRLETLRSLSAMFMNELVATGRKPQDVLKDDEALAVIRRAAKQRMDSIVQFEKGNRSDLAEKEKKELSIIESYLPKLMEENDVQTVVMKTKERLGIHDRAQIGQLMGTLMKELQGKADGAVVKKIVDASFS